MLTSRLSFLLLSRTVLHCCGPLFVVSYMSTKWHDGWMHGRSPISFDSSLLDLLSVTGYSVLLTSVFLVASTSLVLLLRNAMHDCCAYVFQSSILLCHGGHTSLQVP